MARPIVPCAILLAACGAGTDRVSDFIATWRWAPESMSITDCDNKHGTTLALSGAEVLRAGTVSDLVDASDPDGPCPALRLDVTGSTAIAQPGQSCTVEGGTPADPYTTTTTFDDFALELDAAGATIAPAGVATSTTAGALEITCVTTLAGTLIRSDRD